MAKKVAPKNKAVLEKLKKQGLAAAHKAHKDDELVLQEGMNLPAGIESGVAQLTEAGLFEYDEKSKDKSLIGKPYARFTGIVKSPEEHDGVKCKGKRVSSFIPLHDTPKSQKKPKMADHYADLLNELRKFNIDTSEIDPDDIAQILEDLVEEAPHFNFRTWKGAKQTSGPFKDKEPRVQEVFGKVCDYDEEEDPDAEVVEEDVEEDEEDEKPAPKHTRSTAGNRKGKPPVEEEEEEDEADDEEETDDTEEEEDAVDYVALGKKADKGDDEAIDALTEAATEAGLDPDDYPDSWTSLAKAIVEAGSSEEEADDEDEEEEAGPPTEGEMRMYDGVEVIVGKVNVKKQTADVADAETEEEFKAVAWSELHEME